MQPVARRTFIVWYLAGLLGATVFAVLAPILVYIWPPGQRGNRQAIKVTLDTDLSALGDQQATKFEAPRGLAFVMLDGGGANAAGDPAFGGYVAKLGGKPVVLAVNCSHLGCSVNFNKDAHTFDCPCHGSRFKLDGGVIHGPAVYPLSHLGWKIGSSPNELLVEGTSLPGS